MCVVDLLEADVGGWNRGRLSEVFLSFELERILRIRISPNRPKDTWYWGLERDGIYTVCSAYKMMLGVLYDLTEGSSWEREKSLWNKLWKAPVWPRVKLFFGQLCREALAIKANITARVGGKSLLCPFCLSYAESSIHLFRDCSMAGCVWEGMDLAIEVGRDSFDIKKWIEAVWSELGVLAYGKVMVGCWAIWEHRNKVVFDGLAVDPRVIVRGANDVLGRRCGGGGMCGNCEEAWKEGCR
ncbi:uncharacterized protein LOC141590465 [Silene latifolia]|uniref:uncharacterized protein LOC141590465 n=1 Tax=Silene latifolia TaxID=37657 RepID=UPI003D778FEE